MCFRPRKGGVRASSSRRSWTLALRRSRADPCWSECCRNGELHEEHGRVRLGDDWLDRAGRGEIHGNIEGSLGATVVDERTGNAIATDVKFRGGRGLRAGGRDLEVRAVTDRTVEVRRGRTKRHGDGEWGYAARSFMISAGQPLAVRRYLGLPENAWPVLRVGDAGYVFHFGGARRKAVIELLASRGPGPSPELEVNGWFLRIERWDGQRPGWLTGTGPGILELAIADNLHRLERTLARPFANRKLPIDVRIDEVRGWLNAPGELEALEASDWTEAASAEVMRALRVIAGIDQEWKGRHAGGLISATGEEKLVSAGSRSNSDTQTRPLSAAAPETGQLVHVRNRRWSVLDVIPSSLPAPEGAPPDWRPQNVLRLSSIDDDAHGEELEVVWEIEPGATIEEAAGELPDPRHGFDDPREFEAYLHAVQWGAISQFDLDAQTDAGRLQAPFRSGIHIQDYQLDPLVRALQMPRVSLLIADDVGLGKTIEAGLVAQELVLRHRARRILIVCPAGLQVQWREQMRDKFGLHFRILDSAAMRRLRRERGIHVNPWGHHPRLIVSHGLPEDDAANAPVPPGRASDRWPDPAALGGPPHPRRGAQRLAEGHGQLRAGVGPDEGHPGGRRPLRAQAVPDGDAAQRLPAQLHGAP